MFVVVVRACYIFKLPTIFFDYVFYFPEFYLFFISFLSLQRNLKVSGAMGTVRASPKRSEGPKGRRSNRPQWRGITKQAILRYNTMIKL